MPTRRMTAVRWAFVLYLVFMLTITLLLFRLPGAPTNFEPFRSMRHDLRKGGYSLVVNFVGNVVAFLPIGALLPLARGPGRPTTAWHALAFGALFSLAIEAGQYVSESRVADVDDVILNALGTVMGFAGFAAWRAARGHTPAEAEEPAPAD